MHTRMQFMHYVKADICVYLKIWYILEYIILKYTKYGIYGSTLPFFKLKNILEINP